MNDDNKMDLITKAKELKNPDQFSKNIIKEESAYYHEEKILTKNLGWIGKLLGNQSEKPMNIVGLIVLFIVILIGITLCIFFLEENPPPFFDKVFNSSFGLLTLVLGYLFGANSKNNE